MDTATYSSIKKMSPLFLVTDLERSIDFYMKTLGFDIDFRYEDFYAGIVKDGWSIHLKLGSPVREERKSKRDNGDTDIVFSVDGIEELYEQLSNKSLEIVQLYGKCLMERSFTLLTGWLYCCFPVSVV